MNRQKTHGVVYTPRRIVDLILDEVGYQRGIFGKRLIDPACGDGAFLSAALKRLLDDGAKKEKNISDLRQAAEQNICGFDIDAAALHDCAERLTAIAEQCGIRGARWNLQQLDCLNKTQTESRFGEFDFVVGNPPYVRIQHLGEERRRLAQSQWRLCRRGSTDLYILFFELGFHLLRDGGRLGYITPNTYLKTRAGRDLREFLQNRRLLKTLIDFGSAQVFDNVTTYTAITILEKDRARRDFSLHRGNADGEIQSLGKIPIDNLDSSNWILASGDDMEKLAGQCDGRIRLGDIARIHVGITTLADNCYIFQSPTFDGEEAEIRACDGARVRIEADILKPIVKASTLKNPGDKQDRYIIFPYRKMNGRNMLINEKTLMAEYPQTYSYFLSIKPTLLARDKGKPNSAGWYAFGRSQGLDTSFGEKILTSPMNLRPNFIVWEKNEYTFYAGYCIKYDGALDWLAAQLNSAEMEFYINLVSRRYQSNYKSFAKSFIENFYIPRAAASPLALRRQASFF